MPKDINTHFLRVDSVKQPVAFYTLDVIISVDYRVKSQRGVQFRQWANQVLKQYLIKGYAVNQRIHSEQIAELRQIFRESVLSLPERKWWNEIQQIRIMSDKEEKIAYERKETVHLLYLTKNFFPLEMMMPW